MTTSPQSMSDHVKELEGLLAFNRAMSSHERPSHDPKVKALIYALELCRATAEQAGKVEGDGPSLAYRGLQSCRDMLCNQFTPKYGENFDGYLDAMTDALTWMRWAERRIDYAKPTQPAAPDDVLDRAVAAFDDVYEAEYLATGVTDNKRAAIKAALAASPQNSKDWPLLDRVEFALRDAGFDYDEAFRIAHMAAAPVSPSREVEALPPPKWYTREEIISALRLMNYSDLIANELADWFVRHLQHAFNKGHQIGQRDALAPVQEKR